MEEENNVNLLNEKNAVDKLKGVNDAVKVKEGTEGKEENKEKYRRRKSFST